MATVYSGWVGGDDWRIRLDVSVASVDGDTSRVTTQASIVNSYASVNSGASVTTTVNGASYTQTIAPVKGAGTKWGATRTWDVQKNYSGRNVSVSARATMPGSTLSAYRGGTSVSTSAYIPGVDTHVMTFDANGGTVDGVSSKNVTKYYGTRYYVGSFKMARDRYDFLWWNTKADGSGTTYRTGDEIPGDNTLTVYAQWRLRYVAPTIGTLSAVRSDSAGNALDEGTYASVSCQWAVDTTLDASNAVSSVTAAWRKRGESTWSDEVALTAGGATSGTATGVVGTFDTGYAYDLRVTVSDPGGSATQTTVVTPAFYTLDLLKGGRGIAVGKAATSEGLDVGMAMSWSGVPMLPVLYYESKPDESAVPTKPCMVATPDGGLWLYT